MEWGLTGDNQHKKLHSILISGDKFMRNVEKGEDKEMLLLGKLEEMLFSLLLAEMEFSLPKILSSKINIEKEAIEGVQIEFKLKH